MTIQEAKNILFAYFSNNDTLDETNLESLFLPLQEVEVTLQVGKAALADLVSSSILRKFLIKNTWYYVLERPLSDYEQTIKLSGDTALWLGDSINKYCYDNGDDSNYCNPFNIIEKDIRFLLSVFTESNPFENE